MKIERIFRTIPDLKDIVLDKILFESKYPLMFTCKKKNEIYLFICCCVNADKIKWIGTKTTYDNLIELLQNKITIREAFLNITDEKILIEYDGQRTEYKMIQSCDLQSSLLPTEGEFMDAEEDEYLEEIESFKRRNSSVEYVLKPRRNTYWVVDYSGIKVSLSDEYFNADVGNLDETEYSVGRIKEHIMAFA